MKIIVDRMYIAPSSTQPGEYYWSVYDSQSTPLAKGFTASFDQALRNARNFIKNNQNAVFGGS